MSFKSNISDEEFIRVWRKLGSPTLVGKHFGLNARSMIARRQSLELRHKIELPTFNSQREEKKVKPKKINLAAHNVRRGIDVDKVKRVIVFSDAHFTDTTTTAFKALLLMIKEFKPQVIICNGDAFDGQVLSRFPSINYDQKPTVLDELKACRYHLDEIAKNKPAGCRLIWTLGNHDMRYEAWLVNKVPEYSGVDGFSLKYHFPEWETCWSFWIGEDTVVKHRYKGGRMAGYNNLTAAMNTNIITGHTHVLCASPITGYQGTWWGVQTGCLANPLSSTFEYTEDSPKDWRSGFVMLSFDQGRMLMPELIMVTDEENGEFEFRGCINQT
ncbi:MAG: phage HINdeR [Pseudomonadota bacterium]|jgi:predicted phosphodiesterase